MRRAGGRTRGMEEQGTKREDAALVGQTNGFSPLGSKPIDCIRREAAESMRTVDDANRTIVSCTRIEVQAQRDHVLENIGRRLHVRDAALIRPRSIAGYV